jgi:V8-like Glu-specific endopeptidase
VFITTTFKDLGAQINTAATQAARAAAALDALKACEDFVVYLQTINAPTDGVYLAVTPRAFQDIRALGVARADTTTLTNNITIPANMQPMFGGVAAAGGLGAALTQGMNNLTDSLEYMGVRIIKSNHLPVSNFSGIGEARYNLNFGDAGIVGLLFQKGAVAALKLQGLKVDTVDDIRRNTTFTVASMMAGTGVLRPECAAVLIGQTTANTDADATWTQGAGKLFTNANAIFTQVDAANVGGAEAASARNELRVLLGANFLREVVPTASGAFPYA